MAKNICMNCREIYNTKDITAMQRIIADETFCPRCWQEIMTEPK